MNKSGDREADILQFYFQKRKESPNRDAFLVLYEAILKSLVFAYLYLRPKTYALVWKGPQGFRFDPKLPFDLIDSLFSYLSPAEIRLVGRYLPKLGYSKMEHYRQLKCDVILVLAGERALRKYNLADTNVHPKYKAEIVDNEAALENITFARFDSEIEHRGQLINCSLTVEKLGDSTSDEWEFAINLPRDLELNDDDAAAVLKWIVRHHKLEDMRSMNLRESLVRLDEKIKVRPEHSIA